MSSETETLQATPPTSTFEKLEEKQEFNWRQCWYPVTFVKDLPANHPHSFSLYDEPLVLFKDKDGQLICLADRCPHRTAKLSEGQIIDGKIECLYHGWQFGSDGQCLHIPQLPTDAKIPVNACVPSFKVVERQGMIWVWAGEKETAVDEIIPILPDLDKSGFVCADFILDLPYDQTYLVENVIDPAHVAISHNGTRGGGNRKNAQPLEMEVLENSVQGVKGRWRGANKSNEAWKYVDFVAPSLVLNTAYIEKKDWTFGLALYSIPLGKGRCRLLARGYRNFMTWGVKLRPRWLDHLNTNKILEQDLPLIAGQQAEIERLGRSLKELYLPLKTSDTLVIEFRKWLDKFGSSLPFYQGYSTWKNVENDELNSKPILLDRFSRHTLICSSCNRAYQVTNRVKQSCIGVAIALAAVAILADDSRIKIAAISLSIAAIVISVMAHTLKTRFERSYTRH
ncbi:MAG: Rieske 2Fe-2S domain-containing protein [Nostoc sp. JL31]|uniref:aromatic ring-hydroxylating dioxygenase subunit alpha n=1 Tax=Nostoc sp. JL31 TaxID=2815395 RepID=UPI0025F20398|nr:Rieske 2Fe-2S domain-containing protein [Nostoc sp. JL31]MBN3891946.1 Rieske 2Fe-2S domain-containing protein [Nostoc sp. JL31]